MLLFEYQRYKRDAVMRIYSDDCLVDEISLTEDIKLKARKYKGKLCSNKTPIPPVQKNPQANYTRVIIAPEKLLLFEIPKNNLKNSIHIEINNDNNNHTNGFMTKHSFVKFHQVYLLPKCFMEYRTWNVLDRFLPHDLEIYNYNWPGQHKPSGTASWLDDFYWFEKGGSFQITFPIFYKHKIAHLGNVPPGKWVIDPTLARILEHFNAINNST